MSCTKTLLAALSALSVSLGITAEAAERVGTAPSADAAQTTGLVARANAASSQVKSDAARITKPAAAKRRAKASQPGKVLKGAPPPPFAHDVTVNKSKTADKAYEAIDKYLKQ